MWERKGASVIEDEQLIARVLQGEKQAFQTLVVKYSSLVYTTALKIVGNPSTAEDVAQEAFWQAFRSLAGFRSQSSFATWLVRIAINKSLDCRRQEKQLPTLQEEPWLYAREYPAKGSFGSPEEAVLKKEEQAELMHKVKSLPLPYRTLILEHCIKGMTCKELARAENTSVKTIESRIYRARKLLRKNRAGGDTDAMPVPSPAQLDGVFKWSGKG